MFKKAFLLICVLVGLFVFACSASAADPEYPVYVGDVGFNTISDALSSGSSLPVRVVGTVSLTEYARFESQDLIVESSGLILNNGYQIGIKNHSLTLYGRIHNQSNSAVYAVVSTNGNLLLYGDIISVTGGIQVYQTSNVLFSGSIISAGTRRAVSVDSGALSSSLIIDGGSFYSQSFDNPVAPLDSFTFPEGVVPIFQNGAIFVPSQVSVLSDIGRLVSESVLWIKLLVDSVVSNYLLLVFFIVFFVGLGIGLLRRSISL